MTTDLLVLRTAIASPVWRGGSSCFCKRYGSQNPDVISETEHLVLDRAFKMSELSSHFEIDVSSFIRSGGLIRAIHLILLQGMLGMQRTGTDLAHRDQQRQAYRSRDHT
jgi:hypothetical protein